jgi:hypothetical protein
MIKFGFFFVNDDKKKKDEEMLNLDDTKKIITSHNISFSTTKIVVTMMPKAIIRFVFKHAR